MCVKMGFTKTVVFILATVSLTKKAQSDKKIVGGQIAEPHSIPYQAAILVRRGPKEVTLCGGSLVDEKFILTAGHCLKSSGTAVVILGAHDLTANESTAQRHWVNSSSYRIHPEFSFNYAHMDIALIVLPTSVNFSDAIQPVNLPSGFLFEESFSGEIGTVSGFGQTCDGCGPSHVLRFTTNRVMSNSDCSEAFGFNAIPSDTQICLSTAESKSGSCRGDSGSPLTIGRNEKHLQIGLSSFGYRKCEEGQPTVFTRLTRELVAWIHEEIRKELKF